MTWKRVATAAVLIPFVVGLVLFGSTAWVAVGTALIVVLALREYFGLGDAIGHRAYRIWTTACAILLVYAVLTLWTKRPLVEALPAAGISSSALLLVAFPLSFAVRLQGWEREGPRLLLFALVITWVGDTVAYFVGRAMGKHPFAPHLSPKKTWEGAIASFAGSLLVGYAFSWWLSAPVPHLLAMAGVGNVAGQAGDLLE